MIIGPHFEKEHFGQIPGFQTGQIFLLGNKQSINSNNYTRYVQQYKQMQIPDNFILVIHAPYVNNVQSINADEEKRAKIISNSYKEITLVGQLVTEVWPQLPQIYYNIHMLSRKDFNEKAMVDAIKDYPANLKMVFEHTPGDNFIQFHDKFSQLSRYNIGMCYDTAHLHGSGFDIQNLLQYTKPDIIHLNGNEYNFKSGSDKHCKATSKMDNLFTDKEMLKRFLLKFKDIPMIVEERDYNDSLEVIELVNQLTGPETE